LKKSSKKLLLRWFVPVHSPEAQSIKSFLVLFFKKEPLPSFPFSRHRNYAASALAGAARNRQ
jgi:hypothetical protein